jgi:hypothetical protein
MIVVVYDTKGPKIKKSSRRKTTFVINKKNGKRPTSHRSTTYPCYVPILGESAGAGRVGLAGANIQSFYIFTRALIIKNNIVYWYNKKRNHEKL